MTGDEQDQKPDPSVEVARWLREVGRRKWSAPEPQAPCAVSECADGRSNDRYRVLRQSLLLALLTVLLLHYVYADTVVEILSLPSLLVFIFAG